MIADISKMFDVPGEKKSISGTLDLSAVRRAGRRILPQPVDFSGVVENRAGIVTLTYTAEFLLDALCDRCLTALSQIKRMKFSHVLVLSLNREDNDELIVVPEGRLDLAELATTDILLELPTLMVCDEGCKGLCPVCGKNRNEGLCGCEDAPRDGRFAALRKLLREES